MIDENGLSALLIASFYGHVSCVQELLEYPHTSECSSSSSRNGLNSDCDDDDDDEEESISVSGEDDGGGQGPEICPINAFRAAAIQWQFAGDANRAILNPHGHWAKGAFLCGRFNALQMAIMTG